MRLLFLVPGFLLWLTSVFSAQSLLAFNSVKACREDEPRVSCGYWSLGSYYSVSPHGDWFAGLSGGGEYFFLQDLSILASLSPGVSDGYFYLSPSLELNYYFWHNEKIDFIVGYSARYFYNWPLSKLGSQSSGTFHGPGISALYGFTSQVSAGLSVSYQWIQFAGEYSREWYFTLPAFWIF